MSVSRGDGATLFTRGAPGLFVVLWASGFVVARLVRGHTQPESFVSLRFALSALMLAAIAWVGGAPWPRTWRGWGNSLVAGILMQGCYIGGVFWAVKHGLPAGVTALISGLQPLMTSALAGPLLDERVSPRQWLGVAVGFCGALLVLEPNLVGVGRVPLSAVVVCFGATVAITLGTIWQKRIGQTIDLRTGAAIQFVGALTVTLPIALLTETNGIENNTDVWIGLGWGVIVLSVATALLLLTMIQRGAVARVTALFYLVPPVTALMALVLFGEALVPIQIAGMVVATSGVFIASRG